MAKAFPYKGDFVHNEVFLTTPLAADVAKGDIAAGLGYFAVYDDDYKSGTSKISVSAGGGQYTAAIADVAGATYPVAVGTPVYVDSTGALTLTAGSNILAGYVVGDDASVASSVDTVTFAVA